MSISNYSLNRNRRMYLATQSDPLTAVTVSTSSYCLFTKLTLDPISTPIKDPSITGSVIELPGVSGRKSGTFSIDAALHGSGTPGTAPQADVLLKAAFGTSSTVASTSNTYSLTNSPVCFSLYDYRTGTAGGTGLTQQIGLGSVISDASFTFGQDVHSMTMNGKCVYVIDSDNFATDPTEWLGGLESFPAEPTAPTTRPAPITVGFTGAITLDSGLMIEVKSGTIKIATGNDIVDDTFGTYIGSGVQKNLCTVDCSVTFDDSDDTLLAALKVAARNFTPINGTFVVGTLPGSIFTYNLKDIQLVEPKYTDGPKGRVRVDFGASSAHGTTLAGLDAITLVVT